jgi:hypothetical protein
MDWLEHEEEIRQRDILPELAAYTDFRYESTTLSPFEQYIQEPLEVYTRDIITRQDFWNIMVYEFFKRVEKRCQVSFSGGLMRAVQWATGYILRGHYHKYWNYPTPSRRVSREDIEESWKRHVWVFVEGETANIYAGLCVKIQMQYGTELLIEWDTFPPNIWDDLCYELLDRYDSRGRIRSEYQQVEEDVEDNPEEYPDDDYERGHIQ